MASRTMAATAGQSWRRLWQSFPLLQRPLVDRLRVSVGEGVGGAVNLVPCAPAPHPYLLWHCATGAHQPEEGWAPPIRARGEDRVGAGLCRWAKAQSEINTNILSLDLTLPFNFILYL